MCHFLYKLTMKNILLKIWIRKKLWEAERIRISVIFWRKFKFISIRWKNMCLSLSSRRSHLRSSFFIKKKPTRKKSICIVPRFDKMRARDHHADHAKIKIWAFFYPMIHFLAPRANPPPSAKLKNQLIFNNLCLFGSYSLFLCVFSWKTTW